MIHFTRCMFMQPVRFCRFTLHKYEFLHSLSQRISALLKAFQGLYVVSFHKARIVRPTYFFMPVVFFFYHFMHPNLPKHHIPGIKTIAVLAM